MSGLDPAVQPSRNGTNGQAERRLLVFGLGYSASRFVELYGDRFAAVSGTRRETRMGVPERLSLLPFDGKVADEPLREAVASVTHILVSIPPDDEGDPVLRLLRDDLVRAPRLAWIGYLSTVGVYGDFGGDWVDEATPIRPTAPRNVRRAAAEQAWIALGRDRGTAVQVFRLSGIYGPGQNAVENLREGTARRVLKPGQVFNRIHVDDIAGALMAGIRHPDVGPVVNVTDDEPAPPQDVVAHGAELLGIEPPPLLPFEEAGLSPMGRSFYAENKRVSNRVLRHDLGYSLRYSTYREGLRACMTPS